MSAAGEGSFMSEIPNVFDSAADAPLDALLPGARRIVENAAGVQAGETVLIVTDHGRSPDVATALASATREAGALPTIVVMESIASGSEPPPAIGAAMAAVDVILAPTTGTLYHTESVLAATQCGARFLALTGFLKEVLVCGGVFADFAQIEPQVDWLVEQLTGGTVATITASGGTNLTVRLDERAAVPIKGCVKERGERSASPNIEAFIAPLETSADGVVVVDASTSVTGVLSEPLTITVQKGRAVRIEGGPATKIVKEHLERADSPDAYTLAEVAFGLNPEALIRGVIVEDEGAAGTGHVALGSNIHFGGTSSAPVHLDFVYHKPTLVLDGVTIIEDGVLCMK